EEKPREIRAHALDALEIGELTHQRLRMEARPGQRKPSVSARLKPHRELRDLLPEARGQALARKIEKARDAPDAELLQDADEIERLPLQIRVEAEGASEVDERLQRETLERGDTQGLLITSEARVSRADERHPGVCRLADPHLGQIDPEPRG